MSQHFFIAYLITSFLVSLIPYEAALTIDLTHISPRCENLEIVIEGDAPFISNDGIQLTPYTVRSMAHRIAGRAKYIRPLHLWDKRSGELASFFTNFTFVIDSQMSRIYSAGLSFFLAQNNSVIEGGPAIGLPVDITSMKPLSRFVAVKFATAWNDSRNALTTNSHDYVGISVNSLDSVRYQKWLSNVPEGGVCQAWISYNSVSKNLSVSFTGFHNNTVVRQDGLFYTVDLRKVLPERVIFGFSGGTEIDFPPIHTVRSWSFHSSDLAASGKNSVVVGFIVGVSVAIIFIVVLVFVLWMWKRKKRLEDEDEEHRFEVEMSKDFEMGSGPKRFSYDKLARSTGNFAENQKIGEGGCGGVYKGFFKDSNAYVAVKRVSRSSKQRIKEFQTEVMIISRLRHRNLMQLTGWCHENRELLLVYEFMENGSLDLHLFEENNLLTWDTRYKIAQGLGSALLYLHEECEKCVLHGDVKSSNVMLDSNFNPKLGDFGLAKLVEHEKGSKTTMLAGTVGYMAPECVVSGKVSKESDVYSFGVVALEIGSGQRSVVYTSEERIIRLVEWVWEFYGARTLVEAADPRLGLDFKEEELTRLMIVGLWCANTNPDIRPSMRQVIQVLKFEAPLPKLSSVMPVATYIAPPMPFSYGVKYV